MALKLALQGLEPSTSLNWWINAVGRSRTTQPDRRLLTACVRFWLVIKWRNGAEFWFKGVLNGGKMFFEKSVAAKLAGSQWVVSKVFLPNELFLRINLNQA
jgi:hypothetical protein